MLWAVKTDCSTGKSKPKKFTKVRENLYRYVNKTYYAVFRASGKLLWKNLATKDPELARRRLKEEQEKSGKIDPRNADMNLEGLLALYDQSIAKYDEGTQENRGPSSKNFARPGGSVWKCRFAMSRPRSLRFSSRRTPGG